MLRLAGVLMMVFSVQVIAQSQTIYGLMEGSQLRDNNRGSVYYLQIGAYKQKENASRACQKVKVQHIQAKVRQSEHPASFYTVVVGPIKSSAEVRRVSQRLLGHKPELAIKNKKIEKSETKVSFIAKLPEMPAEVKQAEVLAPIPDSPHAPETQQEAQAAPQDIKTGTPEEELEAQARKLYFKSAQLDVEMSATHSEKEMIRLKKQQLVVNKKLDALVNEVIRRVSETG